MCTRILLTARAEHRRRARGAGTPRAARIAPGWWLWATRKGGFTAACTAMAKRRAPTLGQTSVRRDDWRTMARRSCAGAPRFELRERGRRHATATSRRHVPKGMAKTRQLILLVAMAFRGAAASCDDPQTDCYAYGRFTGTWDGDPITCPSDTVACYGGWDPECWSDSSRARTCHDTCPVGVCDSYVYCDGNGATTPTHRWNSDPTCRNRCDGPPPPSPPPQNPFAPYPPPPPPRSHGTRGCHVPQVVSAMNAAPTDVAVQANGCQALCYWARYNTPANQALIVASGGIDVVLAAMKTFSDDQSMPICQCVLDNVPCSNDAEFADYATLVSNECCDEKSESCSDGLPQSCNAGCARVLVPMQRACAGYFDEAGKALAPAKHLVDTTVKMCPGGH